MPTMKAMRISEYGEPNVLRLEDVPRPALKDSDVLVRVHASSVNPFDWKVRAGYLKDYIPLNLPAILGWDSSGVISRQPGVSAWKAGDEVFGQADVMRDGTYAEYVAVDQSRVARKPRSVAYREAGAVPSSPPQQPIQALFSMLMCSRGSVC
jgi:NADPH:quinone reductase-like Zn-dependent oxidoreductase